MIQIDIDMPINCATCPFTRAINTYSLDSMCVLTKKKANEIRHREEWCPLREVVLCKDCLMTKERDEYTGKVWCCRHREYMDYMYYCADGLRREDDEA